MIRPIACYILVGIGTCRGVLNYMYRKESILHGDRCYGKRCKLNIQITKTCVLINVE